MIKYDTCSMYNILVFIKQCNTLLLKIKLIKIYKIIA